MDEEKPIMKDYKEKSHDFGHEQSKIVKDFRMEVKDKIRKLYEKSNVSTNTEEEIRMLLRSFCGWFLEYERIYIDLLINPYYS